MKVTTDACLFGAWIAGRVGSQELGAGRVLDIGTGTGLLSLMIAQKTNALIDTIEIDEEAFEQARENILVSPWKDRINIYHADAGDYSFSKKYDMIISNPPFYENELKSDDKRKNLAHHGGLTLQQLLSIIKKNLSEEGVFFLLLPYKRKEEAERLLDSNNLFIAQKMLVRQSVKHDHFRMFIKGKHASNDDESSIKNEIAITDEKKEYTKEFVELLKDYYLHL